jgi:hypothetical protein
MPDQVHLNFGEQGGFHVLGRGRIQGLDPGDPADILKPTNPRTRLWAFLNTGNPAYGYGPCPYRQGYGPDGASGFVMPNSFEIRFYECMALRDLFGHPFRLRAEVIDSSGGYAVTEKTVTVLPPVGWDGGVPDASSIDGAQCPPVDAP